MNSSGCISPRFILSIEWSNDLIWSEDSGLSLMLVLLFRLVVFWIQLFSDIASSVEQDVSDQTARSDQVLSDGSEKGS